MDRNITIETESNTFAAAILGEDGRVSVLCVDDDEDGQPVDSDSILAWPTDAQIAAAVGFPVRFTDAGDHPTRSEAIYSRADA
jgi:hypothetical protein